MTPAITITEARNNLFSLAKDVINNHTPLSIKSTEGCCILMSQEDYNSLQETIYLLPIADKIIKGMKTPLSETVPYYDHL